MRETLVPVQVRLAHKDIAVLDTIRTLATQRMAGVRVASRPDALKLLLSLYGQQLIAVWSADVLGTTSGAESPALVSAGTINAPLAATDADAVYDTAQFFLGDLCPNGHRWQGTGQSLRYRKGKVCVDCLTHVRAQWAASRARPAHAE